MHAYTSKAYDTVSEIVRTATEGGIKQATGETILEALIDRYTLAQVLEMLGNVCDTKADHVAANWNDDDLCNAWCQMRGKLYRLNESAIASGLD